MVIRHKSKNSQKNTWNAYLSHTAGQRFVNICCCFKAVTGREINLFFLIAAWLLNFLEWQPIQKTFVAIFKDKQNLFYAVSDLDKPSKIKFGKRSLTSTEWTLGLMIYNVQAHLNPRWRLVIDRDACATFWT